ncbi:2-hydroxyacid dehydrogenase [Clostridia bacterium]|nr:2-hydroxyacid dehydrogenase [Clostridia bacterium]
MKVLVTPRSFGVQDKTPFDILKNANIRVVANDTGGIMNEDALKAAIADCEGVIIGVDPLTADVLSAAPELKAIAKYGVGVDNIDMDFCEAHGIKVSRTVGANSQAVADYTFGLMLALARKIIPIDAKCRRRDWKKITTSDVSGKTIGLIGLGAIGRNMVSRAKGFSMEVLAYDVSWNEEYAAEAGVIKTEIDDILRRSDFVCLHLPLMAETENMIDARRLALMKKSAFLINTARGGLIEEEALLSALKNGEIGGAGLDAFKEEPPANEEWYTLENVVMGSHCAASTQGASDQMSMQAAENLIRDLGL